MMGRRGTIVYRGRSPRTPENVLELPLQPVYSGGVVYIAIPIPPRGADMSKLEPLGQAVLDAPAPPIQARGWPTSTIRT